MLHEIVKGHVLSIDEVNAEYGDDVASIIKGLVKTNELYAKSPAIESENFRNLLLSFAEDMRVIPDYDCGSCECDAPNQGHGQRGGPAQSGERGCLPVCSAGT